MAITASMVKELREATGVGMMDCKKALAETNGDMEKAVEFLREKGLAGAAKKAGRIAAEGVVGSYVCSETGVGVLCEVNCETDFVAKTDDFKALVNSVAKLVVEKNPADVDELMALDCGDGTVAEMVNRAVAKIGEKITIRRFARMEGQLVDTYIHLGGKIGVIVAAKTADAEKARPAVHDVAMHIAAAKPGVLHRDEVDPADLDKEREILRAQALNDPKPKPANIIEKMVEGRIAKYYKEVCLLEQPFVKNPDQSIEQMLKEHGDVELVAFVRFEMGEGLQKRQDNFAEEVMGQMKK